MKIATKALVTMLAITVLVTSAVPVGAMSTAGSTAVTRQLDRLQQHHDRKLELRASLLGMTPEQLKDALKTKSFNQILKEHGFSSRQAYYNALFGKLKDELRTRGWSDSKIQAFINKRVERLNRHLS